MVDFGGDVAICMGWQVVASLRGAVINFQVIVDFSGDVAICFELAGLATSFLRPGIIVLELVNLLRGLAMT